MSVNNKSSTLKFYSIHLIVALIAFACLLMNGLMRGGLPVDTTVAERMSFIASHQVSWSLSWCVWMLSALGLLVFCLIFACEIRSKTLSRLGILLVALGIVPDLTAEVIYGFILPKLLLAGLQADQFLILETIAYHLTGLLGNGLYNLGGLVLMFAAVREQLFEPWVAVWGVTAWLLGLALSISVALGNFSAMEFFTATSMVLSSLWMLVFAHRVLRKR